MTFEDYKVVLYRNQPDGWVAEIPAISGCHALMPTAAEALEELAEVFRMIELEYGESGKPLPRDTTEMRTGNRAAVVLQNPEAIGHRRKRFDRLR